MLLHTEYCCMAKLQDLLLSSFHQLCNVHDDVGCCSKSET